ncbi:MAG: DUF4404 family protein [Candidatus Euphemobacter frigidus]|nr:DUF4404 family protein [Candidatus Euphemobacter frigidus]MDP8275625.1 DUF4404 family protein [Candidatus Euphemobacter frigidus]
MIDKTLDNIKETVAAAPTLSAEKRVELLALIAQLRAEITKLSETHRESALKIVDITHASTRHAIREDKDRQQLDSSLEDLFGLVKGFETSHPGLVSTINSFCNALADIGI